MKSRRISRYFIKSCSILMAVVLSAAHCKKESANCHLRIPFVNNSERVVYTGMTREEYYDWGFPNPLNSPELNKTEGGQTNNIALQSRDCFEDKFLGKHPTDKLLVFVIDEQVLQSTPWETIKTERLFLKEYKLTLDDLRKLDWKISYMEE